VSAHACAADAPVATQDASLPAASGKKPKQPKREPRARIQRRAVHGVLLLDKPLTWSSNQALQKVKWLLRAEKAGHTGTLDPLASGVLPLCFGAATKFSQLQLDAPKTYEATVLLGTRTRTADAEGEVIAQVPVMPDMLTPERLAAVRAQFSGPITQVPPMHSALKKDGKALYEYARAGVEVERAPRAVEIHALDMQLASNAAGESVLHLTVRCSKGTYIRTLGEDIGLALGCGGHLTRLRRIETGGLVAGQCVTIEQLEAMSEDQRLAALQPTDCLLAGHTRIELPEYEAGRFLSGMRRRGHWVDCEAVAVYGQAPAALLGVAHVYSGELIPDRLLSPVEIQQTLAQQHAWAARVVTHDAQAQQAATDR
jgi:tRNA pseudouridine55 synthase